MQGIAVNSEAILHHAATDCPNCGVNVSGNFCHACGQETVLHPPSTREFLHEFIGHYVALEGKLWKSLGLLLFRPGRLTLEYIKGRRVRYVQPLRLYLSFSLIFFAVLKLSIHENGHDQIKIGQSQSAPAAQQDEDEEPARHGKQAKPLNEDRPGEIRKGTKEVHDAVGRINQGLADSLVAKLEHFGDLPGEEQKKLLSTAFYGYAPYAIFFMMPLFAFYLKVLYLGSGRRYGEHLLFALHTNGFAFLTMALMLLVPSGFGLVEWLLGLWLAFYLPTAMRRVYGGSRKLTGLRWIFLMLLHLVTVGLAIVAALAFGILH
ncbi:hypothetical protein AB595_15155 [Massilia sp. WF1]|nr:hypothetical protein AB595_15155 [Massilia sp. WF1]